MKLLNTYKHYVNGELKRVYEVLINGEIKQMYEEEYKQLINN